jgi:hypothetical protein
MPIIPTAVTHPAEHAPGINLHVPVGESLGKRVRNQVLQRKIWGHAKPHATKD